MGGVGHFVHRFVGVIGWAPYRSVLSVPFLVVSVNPLVPGQRPFGFLAQLPQFQLPSRTSRGHAAAGCASSRASRMPRSSRRFSPSWMRKRRRPNHSGVVRRDGVRALDDAVGAAPSAARLGCRLSRKPAAGRSAPTMPSPGRIRGRDADPHATERAAAVCRRQVSTLTRRDSRCKPPNKGSLYCVYAAHCAGGADVPRHVADQSAIWGQARKKSGNRRPSG